MSHTNGKDTYYQAFLTASGAAALIGRPWAVYVVLMIGVMVSDPGRMSESAKLWRTAENGGTASELTALEKELEVLKTTLQDKNKAIWEGEAFNHFQQAYDDFTKSLERLKKTRDATGEAVGQSATVYDVGALVCASIAGIMMLHGLRMLFLRRSPLVSYVLDRKVANATVNAGKSVLRKHGIVAAVLAGLLYTAIQSSEHAGNTFPTMKGIPNEFSDLKSGALPEFTSATLEYHKESGELGPKIDNASGGIAPV